MKNINYSETKYTKQKQKAQIKLDNNLTTAHFLNKSQKYLESQSAKSFDDKIHNTKKFMAPDKFNFSLYFQSPEISINFSKNNSILNTPNCELSFDEDSQMKNNLNKPSKFFVKNHNLLNNVDSRIALAKNLDLSINFENSVSKNFSGTEEVKEKQNVPNNFSDFKINNKKVEILENNLTFGNNIVNEVLNEENTDYLFKIKIFQKITKILTEIFKGNHIDLASKNLDISEFKVILKVLEKKYSLKLIENLFEKSSLSNLKESIEELQELILRNPINHSRKRIEENNKFVYKNSLKIMKKLYFDAKGLPKSKSSEVHFYRYYFKEISQKKSISLESFIDPLNVKQNVKTLNNKFLSLIFSSPNFKSDFENTMKNELFNFYQKLIMKKLVKFFIKFDYKYNNNCDNVSLSENILFYLQNNKRIKFPWDKHEIENAVTKFFKKIQTFK